MSSLRLARLANEPTAKIVPWTGRCARDCGHFPPKRQPLLTSKVAQTSKMGWCYGGKFCELSHRRQSWLSTVPIFQLSGHGSYANWTVTFWFHPTAVLPVPSTPIYEKYEVYPAEWLGIGVYKAMRSPCPPFFFFKLLKTLKVQFQLLLWNRTSSSFNIL